ncbi:MAG: hypothetical protein NXI24_15045 [bacterium]|nr:hypothetical protein [bacterium]
MTLSDLKLSAVPARIRAALYSLPLFIGWIVPLTWEDDARMIQAGRRALAMLLLYAAGIFATYLLSGLIQLFVADPGYVVSLIFFILRTLFGLVYVFASLWLAYLEFARGDAGSDAGAGNPVLEFLDRVANRFEKLVSR